MERDDAGNSFLHISLEQLPQHKFEKVVDLLLNYFDINDRNAFGETILHKSKCLF